MDPVSRSVAATLTVAVIVLAATTATTATTADEKSSDKASEKISGIVLLTLDTTRADYFGSYGGRAAIPALDSLAQRGTRWSRALAAASLTLPSNASLLTGLDPLAHGTSVLPSDLPTLASVLGEQGWATAAVVASRVLDRPLRVVRAG